jgi:cytosine/adenosine deaminase-related metal-dependent hydrolase
MRIIQASFIVPLNGEIVENGYLFIEEDGTLIHVTDQAPITSDFEVEVYEGILCPGFVNTHCHLELSHMKGLIPEATGLPEFVNQIPSLRNKSTENPLEAMAAGNNEMSQAGIVAVGDICNTSDSLNIKKDSALKYHSFVEVFGLDKNKNKELVIKGETIVQQYESQGQDCSITPHAPYSMSPQLLEGVYASSKGQLLSIHHQETKSENEMFLESKGDLVNLYEKRALDISAQISFKKSSSEYSLLQYLPKNQKVLLVHNTYSESSDIDLIENHFSNAYWCTCPKANWYIERKLPNYDFWIDKKLKITVGTDSLASNDSLNILEELKLIQKHYAHIPTEELLRWASKNGADFFGYSGLGSFTKGTKPGVLLIENVEGMMLTEQSRIKVLA